jgi:hypothetical protein
MISSQMPAVTDTASQAEISSKAVRRKTKRPARALRRTDQIAGESSGSGPQHPKGRGDSEVCCRLFPAGPSSAGESAQALAIIHAGPDEKHHQPLTRHADDVQPACPCCSACVPPPAPGADILFRRVPHQAKPAWISRKITVWYQGAIRRRGSTPGAETEDTMRSVY